MTHRTCSAFVRGKRSVNQAMLRESCLKYDKVIRDVGQVAVGITLLNTRN